MACMLVGARLIGRVPFGKYSCLFTDPFRSWSPLLSVFSIDTTLIPRLFLLNYPPTESNSLPRLPLTVGSEAELLEGVLQLHYPFTRVCSMVL